MQSEFEYDLEKLYDRRELGSPSTLSWTWIQSEHDLGHGSSNKVFLRWNAPQAVPGALLSLDFPMAVGGQEYPRLHGESYTKVSEATVPTQSYNI